MTAAASAASAASAALPPIAIPRPTPEAVERVRQHPYVRLALNGSFSALWTGQVISLFGDRINQFALAGLVLYTTRSFLASALVIAAAFVPNLLFSPIAGTLVDRWDRKNVLIVSDLLRAASVLLVPIAVVINVWLVYPLVFGITTISLFFRPARIAILPDIVQRRDLLTANSALWVGETLADVIGSALAGLFVAALGAALPIAFWLDAATYIASAVLLSTLDIRDRDAEIAAETAPPASTPTTVTTALTADAAASAEAEAAAETNADIDDGGFAHVDDGSSGGFVGELRAGYRFLRSEPTLLANTIQASVAQLTVGVHDRADPRVHATSPTARPTSGRSRRIRSSRPASPRATSSAASSIGLVGARFAKGRMIIVGYTVWGLLTFVFALTGQLGFAIGLSFGFGLANMVFVIPSQTLFQERTPAKLMGRVVSFRFAIVFGAMTVSTVFAGVLAELVGPSAVIAFFGLVTTAAGLAGLLVPAVRDA